jgi:hypothetical protein
MLSDHFEKTGPCEDFSALEDLPIFPSSSLNVKEQTAESRH